MKKTIRKWCAALRGGSWRQIKGRYYDEARGRCAVGVLREVDRDTWFELDNQEDGTFIATVISMNDEAGKSFGEIADFIETEALKEGGRWTRLLQF